MLWSEVRLKSELGCVRSVSVRPLGLAPALARVPRDAPASTETVRGARRKPTGKAGKTDSVPELGGLLDRLLVQSLVLGGVGVGLQVRGVARLARGSQSDGSRDRDVVVDFGHDGSGAGRSARDGDDREVVVGEERRRTRKIGTAFPALEIRSYFPAAAAQSRSARARLLAGHSWSKKTRKESHRIRLTFLHFSRALLRCWIGATCELQCQSIQRTTKNVKKVLETK